VLEISSFQSELFQAVAPTVGVFLNLSQDHLERHADMGAYLDAKRRLFAFQCADDTAVLNADDEVVSETETTAARRLFSVLGEADGRLDGDRLYLDGVELTTVNRIGLSGAHNLANVLAAGLAATAMGASHHAVATAAEGYSGLAHRHRVVHEAGGVRWIDDSKATNIGATVAALGGYPAGSLHLILGGQGKGQDFSVLADEVRRSVARVYVIGIDGPTIADALADAAPVERCETLTEAVARARSAAEPGQFVLLAPACASFDQFTGYDQRGDVFAALAREEAGSCR
jgi:UDP-N-acetylmuramoylalanine--D-glutamate ligase